MPQMTDDERWDYMKGAFAEVFIADLARHNGYTVKHNGGEWGGPGGADLLLEKNKKQTKVEVKLRTFESESNNLFIFERIPSDTDVLVVVRCYRTYHAGNPGLYICCFKAAGKRFVYINENNEEVVVSGDSIDLRTVRPPGLGRYLGILNSGPLAERFLNVASNLD